MRYGLTNTSANSAPTGSDRPLAVAMSNALVREPVAAKIGAATMIPSGMLCIAIASAMMGPMSVYDENATARPSGMLWRVIVNAISSPSLQQGISDYQCFLLSEISVSSPLKNDLFLLSRKLFSGSKYPKNVLFNFEKGTGDYDFIIGFVLNWTR